MKSSLRSLLKELLREKITRRYLLPPEIGFGWNLNDRLGVLHRAWGYVFSNQIRGAYYEFGVYQGDSFRASHRIYPGFFQWQQQQLSAPEQWRKAAGTDYAQYLHHFYAFDTFQGMPENEEESPTFREGNYSCSLEEFARLNRSDGIQEGDRVRYFSGTFAEIREKSQKELDELQPAAIVNLDCDLYSSTVDALDIVGPKLVQGTVLMVDDWHHFAADRDKGQRKAFSEFLDSHPGVNFESWFPYQFVGQSFIVHIDPDSAKSASG